MLSSPARRLARGVAMGCDGLPGNGADGRTHVAKCGGSLHVFAEDSSCGIGREDRVEVDAEFTSHASCSGTGGSGSGRQRDAFKSVAEPQCGRIAPRLGVELRSNSTTRCRRLRLGGKRVGLGASYRTWSWLSFSQEKADGRADFDSRSRLRRIGGNAQVTGVERLDLGGGLFAFQEEDHVAGADEFSGSFQPLAEHALFHRPAQTRNCDGKRHQTTPSPDHESPERPARHWARRHVRASGRRGLGRRGLGRTRRAGV